MSPATSDIRLVWWQAWSNSKGKPTEENAKIVERIKEMLGGGSKPKIPSPAPPPPTQVNIERARELEKGVLKRRRGRGATRLTQQPMAAPDVVTPGLKPWLGG